MHAAPSVNYPVGRSAFALALAAGLTALGLLVAAAWTLQPVPAGWRQALAFAAAAGCGAVALAAWWRSPTGTLRWNGVAWGWQEGVEEGGGLRPGHPEIALDLQNRLLLRWQAEEGGARWFWLERARAPAHWEALRRAVYSRAGTPVPPAGEPPTA
ncbi:hypothetical protein GCM10028796_35410 [Ramlibacter monticola]|uniref:Uncharacterized protein n=1 Tax=Ramlibacter monticola TaxID=1926872 RepID=A0A937CW49_9BURK|nr:hypothetical protein [Ramlibacter monticola]